MPIINIQGLNREEVAFALYQNVNMKSVAAIISRTAFLRGTADVPGLYNQMHLTHVSQKFKDASSGKIDYLGCIELNIDFSSSTIDTDYYDKVHIPRVNGVESSTVVIEKLKLEKAQEKERVKAAEEANALQSRVNEKLTALLGIRVHVSQNTAYSNNVYNINIDSQQSDDALRAYAATLVSLGIRAEVSSGSWITSSLRFNGTLEDVLAVKTVPPVVILPPIAASQQAKQGFQLPLSVLAPTQVAPAPFNSNINSPSSVSTQFLATGPLEPILAIPAEGTASAAPSPLNSVADILACVAEPNRAQNPVFTSATSPQSLSTLTQYQHAVIHTEAPSEMIVIFLDIDGVLFNNPMDGSVQKRVEERWKDKGPSPDPYPCIECDRAAVDLFDREALNTLDHFIRTVQNTGKKVGIVISSAWREEKTVALLKDLFSPHSFSTFIIDKTVDRLQGADDNSRGAQIQHWLNNNKDKYNVKDFVILDDVDNRIFRLFGDKFILCDTHSSPLFGMKQCNEALGVLKSSSSNKEVPDHKMPPSGPTISSTRKQMKIT